MKHFRPLILFIVFFFSCEKKGVFKTRDFSKVEIEHLLQDSILNVRAIEIANGRIWFSGSKGYLGSIEIDFNEEKKSELFFIEKPSTQSQNNSSLLFNMKNDSMGYDMRATSKVDDVFFTLAIGSPAILTKYNSVGRKIVYKETHPKAFYDSMDFWNDDEGIAIGDSTEKCLSIIITRDGGETWSKLSCNILPKGLENEGAFAASDTNLAIVDNNTWVATTAGRVYYSPDKGYTWDVFNTPIVKQKATEGIYSIDFYDALNGFAIGGDYTKPNDNEANKIKTSDGGKTWLLVAKNQNPGYRSCVQYIPNTEAKELVAIGFKGIDYSKDSGKTWNHLSDEGFYTIRFLNDSIAYAAGAGRISKLTFKVEN